ncbi:hypothetical protein N7509_011591 [Penicillium cosmopolitanum]|uniref:Transcription initiation factor TFIID subunit 4 n=1 Tax=Penicillium cosmopolitanum TaxID=1131564 RepID=A0A9W9SH04_9EURO|nr:uncharacterized protein N7509_011591 [Penicillium cosmopolitanum]KAJ5378472.1 hypothetical protein N7509_011591 [Penicillium cosmopolitanum]
MAQTRHPQQQQQPPPQFNNQPFSPPVASPSPHSASPVNGGIPPPVKKTGLSPHPTSQSPYASPSFNTMQLPPQNQPPMNGMGMAPNSMPATPIAQQAAPPPGAPGTMGPPSVPPSRPVDASELTDVLASSGIDVREEEAFLTNSFPGRQAQTQTPSRGPPDATATPNQHIPAGAQGSFSTEPTSQTPSTIKEPSREDSEAARRSQYHLQEPFLFAKLLEQRIQKRGFELGVRIPSEGLFHPVPGRPQPIEVTGPDGSSVVRTGQTILNQEGAPLVDILNLMSLSCEERLRGVIDYSSTLARSRRAHSHGVVPAEWQDVAQPLGPVNGNTSTPSKRPRTDGDTPSTKPTADRYRGLVGKETSSENRRAAKRTKRSTNAILGEGASIQTTAGDFTGSAPSTPIGERAPSFDKKSMTKKEARKMMDNKASEAQQHQQSVETARLATNSMLSGRMFGAKKSYSWLKPGGSSSGFSSPSRPAPPTPTPGPEKSSTGKSGEPAAGPSKRRLGTWREDQEKGAGIQVRDILFMLEADGRGTKHVQKGYSKDPKEDRAP